MNDARMAEALLDRSETKEIRYRNGDFMVRISRVPGEDKFGRFSMLMQIAWSDCNGWYFHEETTHNWDYWGHRALPFLMNKAEMFIQAVL
jgi:hypothetical protein